MYVWQRPAATELADDNMRERVKRQRLRRGGIPFHVRTYAQGCTYGKDGLDSQPHCYDLYFVNFDSSLLGNSECTIRFYEYGTVSEVSVNAASSDEPKVAPGLLNVRGN